jgi:hypothetical protein
MADSCMPRRRRSCGVQSFGASPCVLFSRRALPRVATPALAEDLVFTLVNDSSHTIVEMYVSPVGEELWGENILTVDAVEPGMSGDVTIADGLDVCDYDLRFVAPKGPRRARRRTFARSTPLPSAIDPAPGLSLGTVGPRVCRP